MIAHLRVSLPLAILLLYLIAFVHGLWVGLQERLIVCNDEHPSHPHLADQCHWGSPWRAVATLDITGDMVVFVGFVEGIWVQIETAYLRFWMKESILCQLFVSIIYKIDKCPY